MKTALVIIAAGLAALALRVVLTGRGALADGDDARARGDLAGAIASYETAARWYLPLAPHVDDAYARLRELARQPQSELPAWEAIRTASLASASLWTPHAADLADANAAIARISSGDPEAGAGAGKTPADRENWYASQLARATRPSPGAAIAAALGIAVAVAGAFMLRRRALPAAVAIVVGIAAWAAGLYIA